MEEVHELYMDREVLDPTGEVEERKYYDEPCEPGRPPTAVQYTAHVWGSGCEVTVVTQDESKLADLVHYCKEYLDAS